MSPPPKLSRRTLTFGGLAVAGVAAIAGAIHEVPRLFKHRASGRYAEIVNQLDNPDSAALVGKSVEMVTPDGVSMAEEAARDLKMRLAKQKLPALIAADANSLESMSEASGWVLPLALAEVCVLAAESV